MSDIIKNLKKTRENKQGKRLCYECEIKDKCIKCIFPFPFTDEEYCHFKKEVNSVKVAELLETFNLFIDL